MSSIFPFLFKAGYIYELEIKLYLGKQKPQEWRKWFRNWWLR
jgi:hypothetical protein